MVVGVWLSIEHRSRDSIYLLYYQLVNRVLTSCIANVFSSFAHDLLWEERKKLSAEKMFLEWKPRISQILVTISIN